MERGGLQRAETKISHFYYKGIAARCQTFAGGQSRREGLVWGSKIATVIPCRGKRYLYRFVHTRDDGRKLRITVTGKNSGTISIAFQNDNPTQVDAEVTAQSLDSDGTLVIMDDELTETAT